MACILIIFCIDEFVLEVWFGPNKFLDVNFLIISGAAMMLVVIWLARNIFREIENTLRRLVKRGTILLKTTDLEKSIRSLSYYANIWGVIAGFGCAIAGLLLFYSVERFNDFRNSYQSILSVIGVFIGARYGGEMLYFGFLGRFLSKENATIATKPRHVDGAAGLKPIGDYYFYQAKLVAIPALFLILWWFIMKVWSFPDTSWVDLYLGLFFGFLAAEVLAFVLPMLYFHEEMRHQKVDHLATADDLGLRIEELQKQISETNSDKQQIVLKSQLANMRDTYWDIENMPTWPVDMSTRRRFALSNIVLFVPVCFEFLQKWWKTLF